MHLTDQRGELNGLGYLLLVALAGVLISGVVIVCCAAGPIYSVWSAGKSGEAKLREAESSRLIQVEEAKAELESAKHLSAAEIERAKGVAAANGIVGDSLKGNEAYLKYLWLQSLDNSASTVVYVPTEANLPILESGRWQQESDHKGGAPQPRGRLATAQD